METFLETDLCFDTGTFPYSEHIVTVDILYSEHIETVDAYSEHIVMVDMYSEHIVTVGVVTGTRFYPHGIQCFLLVMVLERLGLKRFTTTRCNSTFTTTS